MVIVLTLIAFVVAASGLSAPRCSGQINSQPIFSSPPTLVNQTTYGKRFRVGFANDEITVLHVYGTPYQQGYAQGQLLRNEIKNISTLVYSWLASEAAAAVPWLPPAIVDIIVKLGAEWALQVSFNWTKPFIPQRYLDEMQGMADASGADIRDIQNLNQFPELTKAACTVVGATNNSSTNRRLMHLRALDFSPTCPIADFPQVTVYHDLDGTSLVNFGWAGMIGVLTGFSSNGLGVGEKVWDNHPPNIEGVQGKPWMLILRDAITAATTAQAVASICASNRTCAIHVGIGDTATNTFRGLTIAKDTCDVYDDYSISYAQHPILPGIMYWDKHVQPTGSYCLSDQLQQYYGSIDAALLATKVAAVGQTGNMHAATFDYAAKTAYFAVARRSYATDGDLNAYNRHFTQLNMASLFAEKL